MKSGRRFVLALTLLVVGFACDRSPTGVPQPPCSEVPNGMSAVCGEPKLGLPAPAYKGNSNYAVAW